MKKLEWNVYMHDFNTDKIKIVNILNNSNILDDIKKYSKEVKDKIKFSEKIRKMLFYHYGSRCEYEIILTSFPPPHT